MNGNYTEAQGANIIQLERGKKVGLSYYGFIEAESKRQTQE